MKCIRKCLNSNSSLQLYNQTNRFTLLITQFQTGAVLENPSLMLLVLFFPLYEESLPLIIFNMKIWLGVIVNFFEYLCIHVALTCQINTNES